MGQRLVTQRVLKPKEGEAVGKRKEELGLRKQVSCDTLRDVPTTRDADAAKRVKLVAVQPIKL